MDRDGPRPLFKLRLGGLSLFLTPLFGLVAAELPDDAARAKYSTDRG